MAVYRVTMSEADYQTIRYASMRGGFDHEFSRDNRNEVRFKTRNPKLLGRELEAILDSGETSWFEILGIVRV